MAAEHPTVESQHRSLNVLREQSEGLKKDFIDLLNTVQCLNTEAFFSGPLLTVRRGDEIQQADDAEQMAQRCMCYSISEIY